MMLTATCTDGRTIRFDASKPIGKGGEKIVFFTEDRKEVVCFFKSDLRDRLERRGRLEKIIGPFNPTIGKDGEYWKDHFCWPTHIIDSDTSIPQSFLSSNGVLTPALAVIAPAYRPTFFFRSAQTAKTVEGNSRWFTSEKARKLVPPEFLGNFLNYLQVCTKMARAVRRMHFAGLAHSDLSNKNVLISPKHGDACVIDIDSLVVPGIAPPAVMGTPGYIAPEVLSAKKMADGRAAQPCVETDRHALAVLIYEMLLTRHPLRGPKVNSTVNAEQDEELSMGSKALFVEHAVDRSNHLRPAPKLPMSVVGPHLAELFKKAFEEGLHDRAKRPTADDWERALYRTFAILHPSPDGKNWFVLAPGMPMRCPFSGQRINQPVPYATFYSEAQTGNFVCEQRYLTIYHNLILQSWHLQSRTQPGEGADRSPKGYFALHQGKWLLVNNSGEALQVVKGAPVPHGQGVEIRQGLQIIAGNGTRRRLLAFDFMYA
jgi:hypothetical protein